MTATHRLAAGPPVAQWHRPLLWLAVAMAILVVVSIGGMIVDGRVLTGLPIWAKSVKFTLSTLIYAVTWAWLIAQLTTWRRVAWSAGTVAAVGLGLELVVIVIQIVRGTTSHFNFTTPFDAALWNTMGLSIMGVWLATVLVAAALFRFDLFLGRWIYLDSRSRGIHSLVISPLLLFTILLAPLGVLAYLLIRSLRAPRPVPEPRMET
ncbi:abscisic acid-deficient protein Aba4 family protein [Nocardia suismassiliense]|uniref:Abscisic acid-deficient protein Aba4 family protein n=1 Tax=Nocardia suismassiliense TaxID=2077092 RepID=A0ABW6QX80_9NOCA